MSQRSVLTNAWKYLDHCYQLRLCLLLAYAWDACHEVSLSSDLSHLVAEIRALRGQLEQSIQVNNCLRLQLEQQLDGGGKAGLSPNSVGHDFAPSTDPGRKQPPFQGRKAEGIGKPAAGREVARIAGGRDSLASSTLPKVRGAVGGAPVRCGSESVGLRARPATYRLFALGKAFHLLPCLSLSFLIFKMRMTIVSTLYDYLNH